ncbi:MAG: DoxX family membrane protein [Desulfovibrionaceae bacterium]|nr:DoxX family membrane protein [Desulfovibrionaceae bacterium]MBF0514874.1 DoxX family membrane protein [Desulfovibrionaceae bacterium]
MKAYLDMPARFVFGLVFVYAGAAKIAQPAAFAADIFQYQLLSDWLIYPAALFLPWLEAVCGLCLWAGAFKRGAAALCNLLLAVFMAALAVNVWRGNDVACGCFGGGGGEDLRMALIRDGALLALGLVVQYCAGGGQSRPKTAGPSGSSGLSGQTGESGQSG